MSNIIKALIVTLQENESNIYELNDQTLKHTTTIDNDMTTSHEEASENFQQFATGRGKILGGNEGQWKGEVHKHILKDTFAVLNSLYQTKEIKTYKKIIIFFSSNIAKHDLEEQIEKFSNNNHNLEIEIENKTLTNHEAVEKAALKHFE
jgi:hypothetical protein